MKYSLLLLFFISANSFAGWSLSASWYTNVSSAQSARGSQTCTKSYNSTITDSRSGGVQASAYICDNSNTESQKLFLVKYGVVGYCPDGTFDDGSGLCSSGPPPVVCPDSGTSFTGTVESSNSNPSVMATVGGIRSVDGCGLVVDARWIDCVSGDSVPAPSAPNDAVCYIGSVYKHTGLPVVTGSDDVSLESDTSNPQASLPDPFTPLTDGDHIGDAQAIVYGDTVTVVLPNGSTVTTKIDVSTETKDAGVKIRTNSNSKTVAVTDGIQKTTTTTTTTTENSDSSKTIKTTVDTAFSQSSTKILSVNSDSGSVVSTNSPAVSGNQSTTTTDSFDGSGAKTGTSTTTDSSGTGGEEENGSDCEVKPNSLDCIDFTSGEKGSFDGTGIQTEVDAEIANVRRELALVRADIGTMFDVSVDSSNVPECIEFFSWNGEERNICLNDFSGELEPIRAMFLLIGFILALYIILR